MAADGIPLVALFVEAPDFRQASGKRYPLAATLALACATMLCGYRSYSAIAEWGRNYGRELMTALGFPNGQTPCASRLHWIFCHVDCAQADLQLLFQERQGVAETLTATETVDPGQGRIEVRRLTASSALGDDLAWPGLQQVFEIARTVTRKRTGPARRETVYGTPALHQAQRRCMCHQPATPAC